jgi:hypothetical protein
MEKPVETEVGEGHSARGFLRICETEAVILPHCFGNIGGLARTAMVGNDSGIATLAATPET